MGFDYWQSERNEERRCAGRERERKPMQISDWACRRVQYSHPSANLNGYEQHLTRQGALSALAHSTCLALLSPRTPTCLTA